MENVQLNISISINRDLLRPHGRPPAGSQYEDRREVHGSRHPQGLQVSVGWYMMDYLSISELLRVQQINADNDQLFSLERKF